MKMDGLGFLQSLLKCPENLFSGNYARIRHVQFDKSHQKYGTGRACASIFSLVLSNGLQRDRSDDGSTLKVGSTTRVSDARVLTHRPICCR
jgi:hypothetical protein